MNKMQEQVLAFHKKFGHPCPLNLTHVNNASEIFRLRLITEELGELIRAMDQGSLVEIADALGDILYVVFGTAIVYGMDMEPVFDEIQRANMSKDYNGDFDKPTKPEGWTPPDIKKALGLV